MFVELSETLCNQENFWTFPDVPGTFVEEHSRNVKEVGMLVEGFQTALLITKGE